MSLAKQISDRLLEIGAVKLSVDEPFTWASGWKSPIYCDNRVVLSYPAVRTEVIDGMVSAAKQFGAIDGIAGVATAGIPHGALLADRLSLPYIYIRSKAKAHGRQNQIEGDLRPNGRYLMIEDLISTGGSVLQACQALQQAGGKVAGVLAIFTYQFPQADQAFKHAAIKYATLSNYTALIETAIDNGIIAENTLETLKAWRQAPSEWGVK